jgi:FKBP-type peptidyl-prolyl cis-trans isomerase SlyD
MTGASLKVADNLIVSLAYVLRLDDGEEVERSGDEEPLQILQGQGEIIPGLEQALYGMGVGEEKEVVVAPRDGYGDYDPEEFETVAREVFPAELELTPGMGLFLRDQESGQVYETIVSEILPDQVTLDLNHPLAGETLHFHVKVTGLRNATSEELEHGHAHDELA